MGLDTSTPPGLTVVGWAARRAARGGFPMPERFIIGQSPEPAARSVAVIGSAQVVVPGVRIAVFGMPADVHLRDDDAPDVGPGGFQDMQGLQGLGDRRLAPVCDEDCLVRVG